MAVATAGQALPHPATAGADTHTAAALPKASRKKDELDFELANCHASAKWSGGAGITPIAAIPRGPDGVKARYHRVPPGDVRNRVWIHVEFFSFSKFPCPDCPISPSTCLVCQPVDRFPPGLSGQGSLAIRTPRCPAYPRLSFSSASTLS
ncbi:hypothetical protein BJY00DRAFT_45136 [Aspergillus carlsbadensis]|nr:hypothetical protein BJY00DRAFT_45136 [Aspergillus carlsbadensis]